MLAVDCRRVRRRLRAIQGAGRHDASPPRRSRHRYRADS